MSDSEDKPPEQQRDIPSLFEASTKVLESGSDPRPRSEDFLKKVKKWKSTQRGDNSHLKGLQPTHRATTLKAIEAGDNLNKNIQNDFASLEKVEESLSAMKTYVEIGNAEITTNKSIIDNSVNVDDCMKVKNDTKNNVRNAQKALAESQATAGDKDPNSEPSVIPTTGSAPKKGGILGGGDAGGNGDGSGGLKLARLHNQARLNKIKQARQQQQQQQQGETPTPDIPHKMVDSKDMTFLTGLTVEDEEEQEQDSSKEVEGGSHQNTATRTKQPPSTVTVSSHKVVSLVKHHTNALPLSSDDVHTPPEKSRPPPRSQAKPPAPPVNTKLLATPIEHPLPQLQDTSQPMKMSKFNHHGQSAPSLSVHDVHALASSVVKRQHMATRGKSSARRGGGRVPTHDDDDLLEEEVAERQLMWLMKVEAKNRAAKRDKENRIIEELKMVPDITSANASWAKAKKLHAREVNKEKEAENMKKKLDNMKSELHVLRLEEKAIRLRKVQQTRQMEMMQATSSSKIAPAQGQTMVPPPPRKKKIKRKKKKEKERDSSLEKQSMGTERGTVAQQERLEIQQKFQQRIPVTARGRGDCGAGDGGSGVKQLLRMKNRPKSANAVMKWSTLKSYDKKFDVLDMVLSPSQSEDGGGVFAQLPSTGRRGELGREGVSKSRNSPFLPAPSSGGWVDESDETKQVEEESFGNTRSNGDKKSSKTGGGISRGDSSRPSSATATTHTNNPGIRPQYDEDGDDDDSHGLSMHELYRQQQQTSQQEYLADRPFIPQPHIKKQQMPCNLTYHDESQSQALRHQQEQKLEFVQNNTNNGELRRSQEKVHQYICSPRKNSIENANIGRVGRGHSDCDDDGMSNNDSHQHQMRSNTNDFLQPKQLDAHIKSITEQQAAIQSRQEERYMRQEQNAVDLHQTRQQEDRLHLRHQQDEMQRLQVEAQQHQKRIDDARQLSLAHRNGSQQLGLAPSHRQRNPLLRMEGNRHNSESFHTHDDYEDESVVSGVTEEGTYVDNRGLTKRASNGSTSLGRSLFNPNIPSNDLVPLSHGSSSRGNLGSMGTRTQGGSDGTSVMSDAPSITTDQESRSAMSNSGRMSYATSTVGGSSYSSSSQMTGRFFDQTSTADKGRYRVHDARDFDTKSMFRKPDLLNNAVTLLMGKKRNSDAMDIITVLFDRAKFSEEGARLWWNENRDRLMVGQW